MGSKSARKTLAGVIAEAKARREESSLDTNNLGLLTLTREHLNKSINPAAKILLAELEAGAPLTGPAGIRRKLAAIDLAYFGRAYLPHYFNRKSPDFHKELDESWTDGVMKGLTPDNGSTSKEINRAKGCRHVKAAPRGHAKSTNLTFKGSLHAVLYEYKHFILIISDSSEQSEGFLEAIRTEIEENEAVCEDFGDLAGKIWRSNVLVTKTNVKVEAVGSGKKVRGRKHGAWRPDLIILDDVENDENVATVEQRKKLENWFKKAVSKAGDDYTDIIFIGTLLHYDSLLAKLLKNPGYKTAKYQAVLNFSASPLWDEWEALYTDLSDPAHEQTALAFFEAHKDEMLAGTKVLWEAKLNYYDLMVAKAVDGEAAFRSELQNEPINPEDCLFQEEWFDYYNPHEVDFKSPDFAFFGYVDPSLGKTKKSDFSAIITIALNRPTGYMFVLDADICRRHPDAIIADVLAKADWLKKSYNAKFQAFGVETVQFQWFLKEALAKESARQRVYLPLVEVPQTSNKILRISTLQPDIKNKYIKFQKSQRTLIEQLKYFPMSDYDDGPDALEGCRTLCAQNRRKKARFGNIFGLGIG